MSQKSSPAAISTQELDERDDIRDAALNRNNEHSVSAKIIYQLWMILPRVCLSIKEE
jgi:hypothetical protein